ncbi:MAG: hypothetical protein EBR88_08445 [Betaproteobacteria bacterium]|nr:hypothetical protein [Betaproteobacteria bacterium]
MHVKGPYEEGALAQALGKLDNSYCAGARTITHLLCGDGNLVGLLLSFLTDELHHLLDLLRYIDVLHAGCFIISSRL